MRELPPPTGTPVAFAFSGDPWAEQARRHQAHLADRRALRRRRLLRFGVPATVLLIGGATAAVFIVDDRSTDTTVASATTRVPSERGSPTTGALATPADAASVDEVWLLDRGDGDYEWGAIVSSASEVLRRDLVVAVLVLDADGAELLVEDAVIAQLVPDGQAVIGGVLAVGDDAGDAAPTRIEVTATLGRASPDADAATLALSDVRRISSGQLDRDDRLLGTIDVLDGDVAAVRVAVMWRDEAGRVIASVIDDIDLDDAARSVEFSLGLPRAIVPAGEPDDIVVNVAALN